MLPIARIIDHALCILPRAFRVTTPFILHTPITDTKRRCWRDFDKIKVVNFLEVKCCFSKRFGCLVINGEVPPKCNRWMVNDFALDTSLHTFFMCDHGICLTIQNIALPRLISMTMEASLKVERASLVRVLTRT